MSFKVPDRLLTDGQCRMMINGIQFIYLRRNWGGEYENVSVLVAIAVNEDGFREVLGAAEGMKEDKASWVSFFQWLRGRGLDGVKLIVGDKCIMDKSKQTHGGSHKGNPP